MKYIFLALFSAHLFSETFWAEPLMRVKSIDDVLKGFEGADDNEIRFIKKNLKSDTTYECLVSKFSVDYLPQLMKHKNVSEIEIKGKIRYPFGIKGPYHYFVRYINENLLQIEIPIYYRKLEELDVNLKKNFFENVIPLAESILINDSPYLFNLDVNVSIVDDIELSTVRPRLLDKWVPGPYYSVQSTKWGAWTMSHELGHHLGLVDEYTYTITGGSAKNCSKDSKMCMHTGNSSRFKEYHYYNILRRAVCQIL